VTLSEDQIVVEANADALSPAAFDMPGVVRHDDGTCKFQLVFHMRRRQGAVVLEPSGGDKIPSLRIDKTLVRAVALARQWASKLESGTVESVRALARADGLCHHYVARLLPLAYLAPDLTEAILRGAHSRMISLTTLTAGSLPLGWDEQRQRFAELAA
jgi:hypothetical protein